MPPVQVLFYAESDGSSPVVEWLESVHRFERRAFAKIVVRIRRLAALGHELRRPEADLLRDGIHELRIRHRRTNYRLLYFFHAGQAAVLAHGLTKEAEVPAADIDRALRRREAFEHEPAAHTYSEDPTRDD